MSNKKKPPLVLVDGSSYLYRAFHALPPLSASSGQATGAVKGVIAMLRRLQKDYPDSTVAVIFDAKGKTFRDVIYADYKAHRPPMPDELREQIKPIHAIIKAMGLPLIVVDGVEADDVMGTYAHQGRQKRMDIVLSTGDKDMAQLVNEHITLVNTMTGKVLDVQGVEKTFGIGPSLIVDYLALVGDTSDNIPGVTGIGKKTALALLQGVGGLDKLFANLDTIATIDIRGAKSLPAKLQQEKDKAYLSYRLATIKTDVDLPIPVAELSMSQPDHNALLACFEELEFATWIEEERKCLKLDKVATGDRDYQLVLSEAALDKWIGALKKASVFAVDTETTSLNYRQARVVGVSVAIKPGQAAYIPFAHNYPGAPQQLTQQQVLGALKPLLEDPKRAKVGQNLKYDKNVLANHAIDLQGIAFDTLLESYVLNATSSRHDLDTLALKYLDVHTIGFEDIAGKGAKQKTFNQIELDKAALYAAEDADISLQLHHVLADELAAQPALQSVYDTIECPLIPILSTMECSGVLVDSKRLKTQSARLAKRLSILEEKAFELAGEAFNLGSTQQLAVILFKKLKLPVIKKTPKGAPSTAEDVLVELALDYPLPKILLEYRELSKLKSTYTDKLPTLVDSVTGRIHTSYHQAVTATGRLSSSDPNLQNIPVRSEEGRRVRQAFIAPPGSKIIAADYSQIELRIMAHLSQDEGLLAAFAAGHDIHKATAAEVFNVSLTAVSAEQRRRAKAINFGLIYGMSAFGLAKQLGVSRASAQTYINTYFARYPGVQRYMDETRARAAANGYVETLFGRRLYLPNINARNSMHRFAAERAAINAPMQGTAADIIKRAMIIVSQHLTKSSCSAVMIMQVHDELVFEVKESFVERFVDKIAVLMKQAADLDVPLIVDVGVGDHWDAAH